MSIDVDRLAKAMRKVHDDCRDRPYGLVDSAADVAFEYSKAHSYLDRLWLAAAQVLSWDSMQFEDDDPLLFAADVRRLRALLDEHPSYIRTRSEPPR